MGLVDSIGLKVRELRKKKKLTQDDLAEKAGITGKYLGMVERGEVNVTIKVLENLADVLGVKVSDFFQLESLPLSPEEQRQELLQLIAKASDAEVTLLLKIAQSALK